ncbi:MAG TPA: glycosyltransferase family 4 protein [Candidatus Didemnitutus sp.]|jgi:glycosyltransferase involved in cell wall biosynthesis
MKLVVLAQTPPPVHGQSVMVRALVDGLPGAGIDLRHVNLRLSRSAIDIGRWRPGKILAVLDACVHAVAERFASADTLYYVPAPGKRGALYRDWVVMLFCRPFFRRLILHWHATGLGEWLRDTATPLERAITQRLLGGADLALVLTDRLRGDADALAAKKVEVVANGVSDPGPPLKRQRIAGSPFTVLFLGLCAEEKGLFDAIDAVVAANQTDPARPFHFVAAGAFGDAATAGRFAALAAKYPAEIRHAGFVSGAGKQLLWSQCDCICLPSRLGHEGQPLVLLEALCADLPMVATRWRGIPDTVPSDCSRLVAPGDVEALAAALVDLRANPPAPGVARQHYLDRFTLEHHVRTLAAAIESIL